MARRRVWQSVGLTGGRAAAANRFAAGGAARPMCAAAMGALVGVACSARPPAERLDGEALATAPVELVQCSDFAVESITPVYGWGGEVQLEIKVCVPQSVEAGAGSSLSVRVWPPGAMAEADASLLTVPVVGKRAAARCAFRPGETRDGRQGVDCDGLVAGHINYIQVERLRGPMPLYLDGEYTVHVDAGTGEVTSAKANVDYLSQCSDVFAGRPVGEHEAPLTTATRTALLRSLHEGLGPRGEGWAQWDTATFFRTPIGGIPGGPHAGESSATPWKHYALEQGIHSETTPAFAQRFLAHYERCVVAAHAQAFPTLPLVPGYAMPATARAGSPGAGTTIAGHPTPSQAGRAFQLVKLENADFVHVDWIHTYVLVGLGREGTLCVNSPDGDRAAVDRSYERHRPPVLRGSEEGPANFAQTPEGWTVFLNGLMRLQAHQHAVGWHRSPLLQPTRGRLLRAEFVPFGS